MPRNRCSIFVFLFFFLNCAHVLHGNHCNRTCGNRTVRYPFGFGGSCPFLLDNNCEAEGDVFLQGFKVLEISNTTIVIRPRQSSLKSPECYQNASVLPSHFSRSFGLTSRNTFLMRNCNGTSCLNITQYTQIQAFNSDGELCSQDDVLTSNCLWNAPNFSAVSWLDWNEFMGLKCQYIVSGYFKKDLHVNSLDVDVDSVEMGWWIDGPCTNDSCSQHGICNEFENPWKKTVHRCSCLSGYDGDGFIQGDGCKKKGCCNNNLKLVLGITSVIAVFTIVVGGFLLCYFCKKRPCTFRIICQLRDRNQIPLWESGSFKVPIYSYGAMERATKYFADEERLGAGAFGTVYSGKLDISNEGKIQVAVKRINYRDKQGIEQVLNEIKLITNVCHPNLVKLLGCCLEKTDPILVYEYMPNGTLADHLQRERGEGLEWRTRLKIAAETSSALAYLHSGIDPPIYHRDVKSTNILLDYNLSSKVADFGLSRLVYTENSHVSTAPQGTPGYLDPQYHESFVLSDKSDVYSFGVVLAEILTGAKVVDFTRKENEITLASFTVKRIADGLLGEIVDPLLQTHLDMEAKASVYSVGELCFRCLAFDRNARPPMVEVAHELQRLVELYH